MAEEISQFECHITVEPVFGDRLQILRERSDRFSFRVADLVMVKNQERSSMDSFCIGHGTDYDEIHHRGYQLIDSLKACGFKIYRIKIEEIVTDVRFVK